MFFIVYLFIFIYRSYYTAQGDAITASTTTWVGCKLVQEPQARALSLPNPQCGDRPSLEISVSLFTLLHFAVGGHGLFIFLIYGTQWRLYELWAFRFGWKSTKPETEAGDSTQGSSGSTLQSTGSFKGPSGQRSSVKAKTGGKDRASVRFGMAKKSTKDVVGKDGKGAPASSIPPSFVEPTMSLADGPAALLPIQDGDEAAAQRAAAAAPASDTTAVAMTPTTPTMVPPPTNTQV